MAAALREVSLDDKYLSHSGRIYLTGTQALVRLALVQRERDAAAGLNTAGFISGYRGSPIGMFDFQLWKAKKLLEKAQVVFRPGVNEDLAATAVWGTQQVGFFPGAKHDGVFAMWYGKGPGVDRSGDVLKHGSRGGSSRHGGVLVIAGDDHPGKSSTICNHSEPLLAALGIPTLYPASVQEILDFGLHGFAMSRYSGAWVGFKTVNETVEMTGTADVDPSRLDFVTPADFPMPEGGLNARPTFMSDRIADEIIALDQRLPAVQAYAFANGLDRLRRQGLSRPAPGARQPGDRRSPRRGAGPARLQGRAHLAHGAATAARIRGRSRAVADRRGESCVHGAAGGPPAV
jgi:indolepyruvate ferredoxin oxidoreductase